jgi:hypothetical protein
MLTPTTREITSTTVKVRRHYADPAMRGYYYWQYEGVSRARALELAAEACAAQCVDYIALEASPTP